VPVSAPAIARSRGMRMVASREAQPQGRQIGLAKVEFHLPQFAAWPARARKEGPGMRQSRTPPPPKVRTPYLRGARCEATQGRSASVDGYAAVSSVASRGLTPLEAVRRTPQRVRHVPRFDGHREGGMCSLRDAWSESSGWRTLKTQVQGPLCRRPRIEKSPNSAREKSGERPELLTC